MRYRSRTAIIGEILDVASGSGATRTRIMYKAYLSLSQLTEYLPALTERGLLHYDSDAQTFKTTLKGLRFLATYNRLYETMKNIPSPIQQQVNMQWG